MHYITNIVFFSRIFLWMKFQLMCCLSARTFNDFSRLFSTFRSTTSQRLPPQEEHWEEKRSRLRKLRAASRSHRRCCWTWMKNREKEWETCSWSDRGVKARNDYCRNRQFTASLIIIHQFSPMIFWLCILFPQFRPIAAYLDWQLDLPTLIQIRCNSSSHWARSKDLRTGWKMCIKVKKMRLPMLKKT